MAGYWPSSFLRVYGPRRSRQQVKKTKNGKLEILLLLLHFKPYKFQIKTAEFVLVQAQAAQTLNTIITISLAVYKKMYENASKITITVMCRK